MGPSLPWAHAHSATLTHTRHCFAIWPIRLRSFQSPLAQAYWLPGSLHQPTDATRHYPDVTSRKRSSITDELYRQERFRQCICMAKLSLHLAPSLTATTLTRNLVFASQPLKNTDVLFVFSTVKVYNTVKVLAPAQSRNKRTRGNRGGGNHMPWSILTTLALVPVLVVSYAWASTN